MRWRNAIVAIACTTTAAFPAFLTAALSVQIRQDLGIGVAAVSLLFGWFFGIGALGSPPLGRLVDRIGWRAGMRIALAVVVAVQLGIAAMANSMADIAVLFAGGGLAAAMANTSANRALAHSVPADRYGILFGLKHSAAPTATLLGGLAVPAFGLTIGWRWAFVTAAALTVAVIVAIPGGARPARTRIRAAAAARPDTPIAGLVLFAGVAALGIAGIDSITSFLPSLAVDRGMTEAGAGILVGAASVMGLVTRLAGGWLIDRRQTAGLATIAGLLGVGALGVVGLASGGSAWLVAGTLLAYLGGWGWSGLMTFTVVRLNRRAPAAATGISQTGTFVGAALGPPLIGWIADHVSYTAALWTSAATLLAATLLALLARLVVPGARGSSSRAPTPR